MYRIDQISYDYIQSTQQAFYFIETIKNVDVKVGDLILAYNGNTLVGSREWIGPYTDIPVMGYMDEFTENYCRPGDIPIFVIEKEYSGEIIEIEGFIPKWKNKSLKGKK